MTNPFSLTKAEEFNHSYEDLASLMAFKAGVADILLNSSNVFLTGSRGSGKSMYLKLLSFPVKTVYEGLAQKKKVEPLPTHKPYIGIYVKFAATIFGPHEYENKENFREMFQQLFNIYCAEHIAETVREGISSGLVKTTKAKEHEFIESLAGSVLIASEQPRNMNDLVRLIHQERITIRQKLNSLPYLADQRSQPDVLWDAAKAVAKIPAFSKMRVHLLIDEFDSLSPLQQQIVNNYLRKRDFPITFKIACKKHKLELIDIQRKPLNPSGDFSRVELDDEGLGTGTGFSTYLEDIANKRLKRAGISVGIRKLLGPSSTEKPRPKTERKYFGFGMVTTLSSGIVRTFLELCRDMYAQIIVNPKQGILSIIDPNIQNKIVKDHANLRWNSLSQDRSARPELQQLIERVVELFREKAKGSENQMIRIEILDHELLSPFFKKILELALEYEALVQPNFQRLQKNSMQPSRGYVLNRLLCVHFRLEPSSRWDAEISAHQFEKLVLGPPNEVVKIARASSKGAGKELPVSGAAPQLYDICPILDQRCVGGHQESGVGFLACRLPEAGRIKDATRLIVEAFKAYNDTRPEKSYKVKTAIDYPAQGDIACKVCGILSVSEFTLVELSKFSPSVTMELGMAVARQIPTFILFNKEEEPIPPEPFASLEYLPYSITPASVREIVSEKIIPYLSEGVRKRIRLGPEEFPSGVGDGVFVAFPGEPYYKETVVPRLEQLLKTAGLKVRTEFEGRALADLQRAALAIAQSQYCLIDITVGAPTRAFYLGLALGYRKRFASFVSRDIDPKTEIFTDAKSKTQFDYRDSDELQERVKEFFARYQVTL